MLPSTQLLKPVAKTSSASPSSPLSPTYCQISWFYLQNISPNHSCQLFKALREEKVLLLSWCFLPCKRESKWTFLAFGHNWTLLELSAPLFTLSWESEMTSLTGEFMKNILGELSSAQLFSFLLLEVGLLCYSPRDRPFYLTWVCPTPALLRLGGQICLFLGISRQINLAFTRTYILPLCLQQLHENCNIT